MAARRPLQFCRADGRCEKDSCVAVRVGMISDGRLRAKFRATSSGWAATRLPMQKNCGLHLRFAKQIQQSNRGSRIGPSSNVKATRTKITFASAQNGRRIHLRERNSRPPPLKISREQQRARHSCAAPSRHAQQPVIINAAWKRLKGGPRIRLAAREARCRSNTFGTCPH